MKNFFLIPIHIIALLTQAKSFKANPVIGSRLLNILGLHVIRMAITQLLFRLRLFITMPLADKAMRRSFLDNGFVMIENALPDEDFTALLSEITSYRGEARQCAQGDSVTIRRFIDEGSMLQFPACDKFRKQSPINGALRFTSGRGELPRIYIEKVHHRANDKDQPDPQKTLHSDTFHSTMKAWLFLEDVDDHNGPFTYVPGSNRLTWKRFKWCYRKSIDAKHAGDGYTEKGSFRIEEDALPSLSLPAPHPFKVKKNTLVIANTHGFHRRGEASDPQATRLGLFMSSRYNPFNPWISWNTTLGRTLRDSLMMRYEQHLDKKALEKGRKSPWHIVEINDSNSF